MRKWIPVALIVLAVAWFILANIASSYTLSDMAERPVTALSRNGTSIPVQPPGRAATVEEAQVLGGQGIMFGYRYGFRLPDQSLVTCTHRFRTLVCEGGWRAERPPA